MGRISRRKRVAIYAYISTKTPGPQHNPANQEQQIS